MDPKHVEAPFNPAFVQLLLGDYANGFEGFESRFRQQEARQREFPQPAWDGLPLNGQTLLVHCEQGFGDAIQFVRYLGRIPRDGGSLLLECHQRLVPLFERLGSIDQLVVRGAALPGFDCHIPQMSLPRILRTTVDTVPATVPYLSVEDSLVEAWRRRIGQAKARNVGLVWGGNPDYRFERRRGLPLAKLAPLASVGGVALFSLQRGPQAAELESLPSGFRVENIEAADNQITDTAAILANLDLVVTVDTMVAHLAGAMARPVWTLLPYSPDWRWMQDREDSPWYPTMRLFRQPRPGDWDSVIERVAAELADF